MTAAAGRERGAGGALGGALGGSLGGAVLVVLVNDATSPLADLADVLLPLHAGPETSVAATKSFIATLVALTHLTAEWRGDAALRAALDGIGDTLDGAWACDWSAALPPLVGFLVCLYIWSSLRTGAKVAGAAWMLAGVVYFAWRTRGSNASIIVERDYREASGYSSF